MRFVACLFLSHIVVVAAVAASWYKKYLHDMTREENVYASSFLALYYCEAMCYVSEHTRVKALKFDECLSAYKIEHGIKIGKGLVYVYVAVWIDSH